MTTAMTDAHASRDLSSRSTDVRQVFLARHAIIRTEREASVRGAKSACAVFDASTGKNSEFDVNSGRGIRALPRV
jgi:hypothetical protein